MKRQKRLKKNCFKTQCVMFALMLLTGPLTPQAYGQNPKHEIQGIVVDQATGITLPGTNIILQSKVLVGTTADGEGRFSLKVTNRHLTQDSLIVSFLGYQERVIPISAVKRNRRIELKRKSQKLTETVVTGKRIIAEEFTIKEMKQLDIYLNPVSKADPILAVNSMPASTTTDESANISLRGSSPAETGVYFNDVPVYDAVRFSQLDGLGTFSIFNTAIVERLHVFPSNPPLEYGNISSGLIAIQSQNKIPERNQNNISLSLANIGGQTTRRLSSATGLSVFANYQPSAGLIGVNEQALSHLESFFSGDAGIHAIHKFSDSSLIKLFNYSNMEGYEYNFKHASFRGIFDMQKKRNVSIANYVRNFPSAEFTINTGLSFSGEQYAYGNTDIDMDKRDIYFNINYRHFFDKLSLKGGISHDSRMQDMNGTFPVFGYALGEEHPSVDYSHKRVINLSEAFAYGKYDFNDHWVSGLGMRKNLASGEQKDYLSAQWNISYSFKKHHSLIFALGRYHNYALPNAEMETKTLYQSDQVSLDYKFDKKKVEFTSALFAKKTEFGDINEKIRGLELFTKLYLFNKRLNIQGSYTLVDAERKSEGQAYPTRYDMDYYVRGSLKYQHPGKLDISLIMLYREGTYFQPVTGKHYHPTLDVYKPIYASKSHMIRYPDYLKLDLSLSKMWPLSEKVALITFINVSNILDRNNIRKKNYNFDYTQSSYEYYSKRTVYFGGIIYF